MIRHIIFSLKENEPGYNAHHKNGVFLGEVFMKEDGLYDWWPNAPEGCWPSYALRDIADFLDICNKSYELELEEYWDLQDRLAASEINT